MPRNTGVSFIPFIDSCLENGVVSFHPHPKNNNDSALRFDFADKKFIEFAKDNGVSPVKNNFTRNLTSYGFLKVKIKEASNDKENGNALLYYSKNYQPNGRIDREELSRLCKDANAKTNAKKRQRNGPDQFFRSETPNSFLVGSPVTPLKRTRNNERMVLVEKSGAETVVTTTRIPQDIDGLDVSVSDEGTDRLDRLEREMRRLSKENKEIKHENKLMSQTIMDLKNYSEREIKRLTEENQRLMNTSKLSNGPVEPNTGGYITEDGPNASFAPVIDLVNVQIDDSIDNSFDNSNYAYATIDSD